MFVIFYVVLLLGSTKTEVKLSLGTTVPNNQGNRISIRKQNNNEFTYCVLKGQRGEATLMREKNEKGS